MSDEVQDDLTVYRTAMCEGRDAAQDAYDKAVLGVSGGALAIALGFVRTEGIPTWRWLLILACTLFAVSVLSVIYSFRSSRKSFDAQLLALDNRVDVDRVRREKPGGVHARFTELLNVSAFVCLLFGIAALATFVVLNLGR